MSTYSTPGKVALVCGVVEPVQRVDPRAERRAEDRDVEEGLEHRRAEVWRLILRKRLTSRRTSAKKRICAAFTRRRPRCARARAPCGRRARGRRPRGWRRRGRRARGSFPARRSAVVDEGDLVAQPLGLFEVVRREQDRRALGVDPLDVLPQLQPQLDVDARGRLVEDQQPRPVHQRPGEDQPPLHAARERARAVVALGGEREGVEQLRGALAALLARHPEVAAVVVERLLDVRNQSRLRSCGASPTASAGLAVVVDRVVAEDADRARVGCASPVVQWISVDLPAPLGPSSPKNSPRRSRARRRAGPRCRWDSA